VSQFVYLSFFQKIDELQAENEKLKNAMSSLESGVSVHVEGFTETFLLYL